MVYRISISKTMSYESALKGVVEKKPRQFWRGFQFRAGPARLGQSGSSRPAITATGCGFLPSSPEHHSYQFAGLHFNFEWPDLTGSYFFFDAFFLVFFLPAFFFAVLFLAMFITPLINQVEWKNYINTH